MAAPNTVIAAGAGINRRIARAKGAAASLMIPVHATAAGEGGVGGVHDHICLFRCDVSFDSDDQQLVPHGIHFVILPEGNAGAGRRSHIHHRTGVWNYTAVSIVRRAVERVVTHPIRMVPDIE